MINKNNSYENHKHRMESYEGFWGKAQDKVVIRNGAQMEVSVLTFPPCPERGYWVLATSGMSNIPQTQRMKLRVPPRTELILYAAETKPWMYSTLIHLAEFPFENGTFLGDGHTVEDTMPADCRENGLFTSVIFTSAIFAGCPIQFAVEGEDAELLLVFPITDAECKLAVEHGSDALAFLFTTNNISFVVDEKRPCVAVNL